VPIQNVNRVKEIPFSPSARGNTKRTRSTTLLETPFRHLTQFPLNKPLYLPRITIESVTANGSMSALGQKQTSAHVRAMSALPPKADVADSGLDVR
jgi:hypothetical protein